MQFTLAAREQPIEWDQPPRSANPLLVEHPTSWDFAPSPLDSVRLACQVARSDAAVLLLPVGDGSGLRLAAAVGLPGDIAQHARHFLGVPGQWAARYPEPRFAGAGVPLAEGIGGELLVAGPVGRADFGDADRDALRHLAGLIGAALSARADLAQREDALVQMRQRLIEAQERERQRLARELHDEAGHALTIALLRIDLERVKPTTAPDTRAALTQARDSLMEAATALNDMAFRMRPRILEDLGLLPALRTLAQQVQVPVVLWVTLEREGEPTSLSSETELVAFRVVQEALTNARKHAGASAASVCIRFLPRNLVVAVQDDGIGIDQQEDHREGRDLPGGELLGQGVRGMRERVEALGGTFVIGPRPEGGTQVVATLPAFPRGTGDG
jgi:signal transduction histidine kinase